MKELRLKTIEQSDKAGLYTIIFKGEGSTEFDKFLAKFRGIAKLNQDFNSILLALEKVMSRGALDRFFRVEGRMSDNLSALAIDSRSLRLYCLRISDSVLILGNGGVKRTRTYEEDETLSGYVADLQAFDKALLEAQRSGEVTIERSVITGIDKAVFLI